MNRRLISAILLPGLLLVLLLISVTGTMAAPVAQDTTTEDSTVQVEAEPLAQPVKVTVQQRLPITTNMSQLGIATETLPLPDSFALALDLTIEFVVSDTMTSTVPSTVSLSFADDFLNSLPISLTLDGESETLVVIVPQPVLTETEPVTATEAVTAATPVTPSQAITATPPVEVSPEVTATPPVTTSPAVTTTPTVTPEAEVAPIAATANVTANLRSGPGTDFELVGQAPLGSELEIAGITEDATWYLLADASWIFASLVDDAPASVPVATQALIDQVAADAAARQEAEAEEEAAAEEAAVEEADADEPAADQPSEEAAAEDAAPADALVPTPTPEQEAPEQEAPEQEAPEPEAAVPTANVDANLRAGPGTEYEIVGGTITGQELDIVGQNAAGDWYLLSNGGWVADFLISNPPADAPVVPDDASPLLAGEPAAPVLVPTPVPGQEAEPEATEESSADALGLAENLYLDEAETLISRYQVTGEAVTQLVANAEANEALLTDEAWAGDVSTAIATLQRSGQQIRALEPPPLFAAAHIDLRSAAESFDEAATALELGLSEAELVQLQAALAQIDTGNGQLQAAQEKISTVAQ